MFINDKIKAYLSQANIAFADSDYKTEQVSGGADQIVYWDAKLGAQPTQDQLDAAMASYVPPTPAAPTKEELMQKLAELSAQIQALG